MSIEDMVEKVMDLDPQQLKKLRTSLSQREKLLSFDDKVAQVKAELVELGLEGGEVEGSSFLWRYSLAKGGWNIRVLVDPGGGVRLQVWTEEMSRGGGRQTMEVLRTESMTRVVGDSVNSCLMELKHRLEVRRRLSEEMAGDLFSDLEVEL